MLTRLAAAAALVLVTACGQSTAFTDPTPLPPTPAPVTPTPAQIRASATAAPATGRASAAPSSVAGSGRACRYAFPVQPPSVTNYGRAHHDYPATDIFAPRGTKVVAPTDGVLDWVTRVDRWDPKVNDGATRGGLSWAIEGDDGNRYYGSHLLDIEPGLEPGVRVEAGQLLGHVDESGDARGVGNHLHFGISHPTRPDDWQVRRGEVNPFTYLNAWRNGHALTPAVPGARAPSCTRVS